MSENKKKKEKPENERDEKLADITGGIKMIPGNNEDIFNKNSDQENNPFVKR